MNINKNKQRNVFKNEENQFIYQQNTDWINIFLALLLFWQSSTIDKCSKSGKIKKNIFHRQTQNIYYSSCSFIKKQQKYINSFNSSLTERDSLIRLHANANETKHVSRYFF